MLTGAEERASVALLESATKLHRQAIESNDFADWDVAADAYEEYGLEGEAGLCRALAAACRSGIAIYPKPEPTIGPACKRGGEIVPGPLGEPIKAFCYTTGNVPSFDSDGRRVA